jgi:DNA-binding GntR family transcriptional regulator
LRAVRLRLQYTQSNLASLAMKSTSPHDTLGARHAPLNKLVADRIRERILAGEFQPGERLAEERLSEELGVSRMPVREALRALANEGVVTLEPRRGASVTVYSEEQVQELVEVRATLESLNAKLAAKRHDPKQIAELERILAAGGRITGKTDLAVIQDNNNQFHEALERIAANSVLMNIVRSLRDRTALIFAKQSRGRVRQNWQEHAGIVRAVIAGDAELAALLAARHVYNAAEMPNADEAANEALDAKPRKAAGVRRGSGS